MRRPTATIGRFGVYAGLVFAALFAVMIAGLLHRYTYLSMLLSTVYSIGLFTAWTGGFLTMNVLTKLKEGNR